MEKVIPIDGKDIPFRSSAALPLRYKSQFNRDFFADLMKLDKVIQGKSLDFDALDSDIIYNLVWVLAKTADKDIPAPVEWLDTFETFPLEEIYVGIYDLLASSISGMSSSKPAKKTKATLNK
jgi:hypothetical protein